jgi:hypothetical protein
MYEKILYIQEINTHALYISEGYTINGSFFKVIKFYGFINKNFTKDRATGKNVLSLRMLYSV